MTNYLLLIIVPLLLGLLAQWRVKSAFGKYSVVRASSNISGAAAARQVLASEQIQDVEVVEIDSLLGDHYDPSAAWTYVAVLGNLFYPIMATQGRRD